MPNPRAQRRVKAFMAIRWRNGDTGEEARFRGRLRARSMVRRDSTGAIVLEQLLDGDKGPPPRP